MRRIDRQSGVLKAKIAMLVVLLACMPGMPGARAQAIALDATILTDPRTGAALMGFDPVAFHIERRARPGDPERQITHAGRAWYFTSEANLALFRDNPEAFIPAFGGHDAAALAAGVLRSGDPRIFLIEAGKLYFFRDEEARAHAAAQPATLENAAREWPTLRRDLDP